MTRYLIIDGCDPYLAKFWLSRRKSDESVYLVAGKTTLEKAQALKQEFDCVAEVLDTASVQEKVASEAGFTVAVIPMDLEAVSLRHFPETFIPDFHPLYGKVQTLWHAGIKSFEVFNLSGSLSFRVPWMLSEFAGRHKGKRCFVVGNGPSLNDIDMKRLKSEITLGSNRCYLGYEDWGFSFTYWGIEDPLQIEEYGREYETHIPKDCIKFHPFEYLPLLTMPNACPVNFLYDVPGFPKFSADWDELYLGFTVTFMLLQIAAVMGCNPIILVGVDHRYDLGVADSAMRIAVLDGIDRLKDGFRHTRIHNFVKEVRRARKIMSRKTDAPLKTWQQADSNQPTHFHNGYAEGDGKRFNMPSPRLAEKAFATARQWTDSHGVEILNATPGSALETFPLVPFDSLF